jgi:uncharacterized protein (TIGR02996 family)
VDEFAPFRNAVLAAPWDQGPRLVWADRLDELGDRRGAWLRYWCGLEEAAIRVPTGGPEARDVDLGSAVDALPAAGRLLACVLATLTPLADGRRTRDLMPDPRCQRAAGLGGLAGCGLAGGQELEAVFATWASGAPSVGTNSPGDWIMHDPWPQDGSFWAAGGVARAARPPALIRQLRHTLAIVAWGAGMDAAMAAAELWVWTNDPICATDVIARLEGHRRAEAAALGWQVCCCEALAAIPVPPHWGRVD